MLVACVLAVSLAAGAADAAPLADLLAAVPLTPLDGVAPPPLALERLADGKRVTLADLKGRPVLIYFWATW